MKKFMKNVLAVCLTASLAVAAVGCSDKNATDSSDSTASQLPVETVSLDQVKQELTFNYKQGGPSVDATEAGEDSAEAEAETIMEEVTEVETETDADGQPATNEDGIVQMKTVVVETRPVPANNTSSNNSGNAGNNSAQAGNASGNSGNANNNSSQADNNSGNADDNSAQADNNSGGVESIFDNANNMNNNNNNNNQPNNDSTPENLPAPTVTPVETPYTPVYDTCKAYWLDMTQQSDYTFNGEFLVITFEVKEDIPDGNYPLTIATTDIASWDLNKPVPHIINGEIGINATPAAQEDIPDGEFGLKLQSTTAKKGEDVTVVMELQNNPGFCAFVIDVQYDSNALTIVEATGGKDFQKAVSVNANAGGADSSSAE